MTLFLSLYKIMTIDGGCSLGVEPLMTAKELTDVGQPSDVNDVHTRVIQ